MARPCLARVSERIAHAEAPGRPPSTKGETESLAARNRFLRTGSPAGHRDPLAVLPVGRGFVARRLAEPRRRGCRKTHRKGGMHPIADPLATPLAPLIQSVDLDRACRHTSHPLLTCMAARVPSGAGAACANRAKQHRGTDGSVAWKRNLAAGRALAAIPRAVNLRVHIVSGRNVRRTHPPTHSSRARHHPGWCGRRI
jgi:hypothetical protein